MLQSWLPKHADPDAGSMFKFDRPAERGLAGRTYGDNIVGDPQVQDALADGLRDVLLGQYDPAAAVDRFADGPPPGIPGGGGAGVDESPRRRRSGAKRTQPALGRTRPGG